MANETGIILSYTNTSNFITDLNGTALGNVTNQSVSNDIPKTPPIIIDASTNNAGNIITITFDKNITLAGTVPNSAFTFTNTNANVSSISRMPSTQIQLLLDTPVLANETGIILSYTNTSNFITDLNGTALGNVTNQSISNNIPKTPPIIIDTSANNAGNIITITFDKNITLAGTVPNSDFTFSNTKAAVSSINQTSPSKQIQLTLNPPILANETGINLGYRNSSNNITDLNGTALGDIELMSDGRNLSVSNNIPKTPPIIINASTNKAGNIITITFNENITLAGPVPNSAFTFTNTNANVSSISRIPSTQIQLLLDTPVLANETDISLEYVSSSNNITDLNGTALGNVTNQSISNDIPKTPPIIIDTSTNKAGNIITITFDKNITLAGTVPNSDFEFSNTKAAVSSINQTSPSKQIQLTLNPPILANETGINLGYRNSSNNITDLNGTALGDIELMSDGISLSVFNNIPKTPPIIIDASTNNAGNIITITFNEDIDLVDSVPNSAFTFTNTNANISSISRIPSTQIQLLLDTPVLANETGIILSYTNTSNFITDLNGTALGNVTNQSVSNDIPKTPPIIIDASTNNAGNIITITFDKDIDPCRLPFQIQPLHLPTPTPMYPPLAEYHLLRFNYWQMRQELFYLIQTLITDLNGTALGNVTNQSISNNIPKTPPIIIDTSANNAGNIITITFDKNITLATVPNSDFTFSNTKAAVSSINQTSPSKQIQLTLNPPILANETGINLGYRNSSNNITDLNGTALGDIELQMAEI